MRCLVVVLTLFLRPVTRAWSGDAHRVIARIASEFLRDSGKYFVAEHLTGRDTSKVEKALIEHSTYADTVEWSDELHFSHTPYRGCAPFEMERDCTLVGGARRCIVTAIANYTMRASDVELSLEERGEAIKFLIHLVGDIHNPLHVGFAEDLGGNLIHLAHPVGKSLHNVWDYTLVNRKQFEHEVYKEKEEDDAEPWKLSDALLEQPATKQSLSPYLLNLQLGDVATEESATRLAAGMASRTARDFTCNVAYRNEKNEWIESGDSLSEEYSSTRSESAMEMLKLAGTRLGEILNIISHQFSVNKREAESCRMMKPSSSDFKVPNPYQVLVLDFEMDPDSYLFTETAIETELVVSSTGFEETEKEVTTGAKKITKSMKKRQAKARAKRLFEGVDLESVVLIHRCGCYVVTGSQLASSVDYFPSQVYSFHVRFSDNKEAVFSFDAAHFGNKKSSDELIARALMKIRNLDDDVISGLAPPRKLGSEAAAAGEEGGGDNLDPPSFKRAEFNIAPLAGEVRVGDQTIVCNPFLSHPLSGGRISVQETKKSKKQRKKDNKDWVAILGHVPSEVELWKMQIQRQKDCICIFTHDKIYFYMHKDSLEDPSTPMIKANKFVLKGHDGSNIQPDSPALIDTLIFDGDIGTDGVYNVLLQAAISNIINCQESLKKRPSLWEEAVDIYTLLFGESKDRVHSFRRIRFIQHGPSPNKKHDTVHWSIHRELSAILPSEKSIL